MMSWFSYPPPLPLLPPQIQFYSFLPLGRMILLGDDGTLLDTLLEESSLSVKCFRAFLPGGMQLLHSCATLISLVHILDLH